MASVDPRTLQELCAQLVPLIRERGRHVAATERLEKRYREEMRAVSWLAGSRAEAESVYREQTRALADMLDEHEGRISELAQEICVQVRLLDLQSSHEALLTPLDDPSRTLQAIRSVHIDAEVAMRSRETAGLPRAPQPGDTSPAHRRIMRKIAEWHPKGASYTAIGGRRDVISGVLKDTRAWGLTYKRDRTEGGGEVATPMGLEWAANASRSWTQE